MEKIVERYNVKSIHDIWPNLAFLFTAAFLSNPIKKDLKIIGQTLTYIETY
jgi:hypothetical protein